MKYIIYLTSFFILFVGCKKYKELKDTDDLNGKVFYTGQLQFANDLDSIGIPHPIAGTHIQIFKKSELVNYLFDSTTDNLGNFAFRNLKDGEYRIHVNKVFNNIIYDTDRVITVSNSKNYADTPWTVRPSNIKQNAVVFTVKDAFAGVLNGTKIYLYSSTVLANADVNHDGTGASAILPPTNGYGKSVALNIPALPFYVIKMKTLNNLVKTDVISTGIPQFGIVRLSEQIP